MESYVFLLLVSASILVIGGGLAYMSGMFETWIVRKCTTCGSLEGSRMAISHMSSTRIDGKWRGPLHNFWKPGILHDHILCPTCYKAALRAICLERFKESITT